ncbi:MAG: MFS transporter [Chloroflexota bacterium]
MTDKTSGPPPRGGPRGGKYGAVLAFPAFRWLWTANMLSALGEAFSSVALPLLAYQISGSPQLASQVFVARLLPTILLAPASGVLVDRMDRRKLIIAADLIRAALVALIPFAGFAWQIAAVSFLVAIADAVARPAALASVPLSVPPAELVSALSANQVGTSVIRIVGPAAGPARPIIAAPARRFSRKRRASCSAPRRCFPCGCPCGTPSRRPPGSGTRCSKDCAPSATMPSSAERRWSRRSGRSTPPCWLSPWSPTST